MSRWPLTLLTLAVLLLIPHAARGETPRAERPTYAVGDKWVRSDGVYDLVRIENDLYVFAAEGGREIHMTRDLAIAKTMRNGVVEWDVSEPPRFSWPLEVGKWARSRVSRPIVPTNSWMRTGVVLTWQVLGFEDVRIPAGVVGAFRIRQSFDPENGPVKYLTLWYAPSLRQIVKGQSSFDSLASFEVVSDEGTSPNDLRVALDGPTNPVRVASERMTVAGKVTASPGVARVTVALNGREVLKEENKKAGKREVSLNVPVQLKDGENVVLVTAVDGRGETRQETRTVFYEKPPPAPAPDAPPVPALPPLVVSVSSPAEQAKVDQETVALAAVASGGKGVRRVIVALNGVEVARQEEQAPEASKAVNLPLKLRTGLNTVVVTATDVGGASQQVARTIHYEKIAPLSVAVRYPADGLQVTQEGSVVAAVVTSSKGVAIVSVSQNGTEVHQEQQKTPRETVTIAVPIILRDGANALVVRATEPDGTTREELRTVIYTRPPPVAAVPPPPAAPPQPVQDRWAVVIGIGTYESAGIPRLHYTVADAEAVYQTLIGRGGFAKEHVLLLTDKTERKATLRNIRWALGTFLSRSAHKDDTVVIFFAGHGAPEVDPRGLEADGLAKYLIPSDADPEDLYSSALPMDELQTIFARIEAERVVAFLDTCYSGAAGGRTFLTKRTRSGQVDDLFLERLARSKGRAILTASRPAEVSIELPELGHGVFTYYLVQGLNGAADANQDGIVSLQELYEYLEREVSAKSRQVGGNQHPVLKGELEGPLPLVRVRAR
jgi:hypothetical protein